MEHERIQKRYLPARAPWVTALGVAWGLGVAGCSQAPAGGEGPVGAAREAAVSAQACVSLSRPGATVADTEIATNLPNNNYGSAINTIAGTFAGVQRQALLQFDLSSIPPGPNTNITSATLNLSQGNIAKSGASTLDVHRITSPWSEGSVTWNNFGAGYDPTVWSTFTNASQYPAANVSALVAAWVQGTYPNHGLLLESPTNATSFYTSEYSGAGSRPDLNVCFTVTCDPGFADCNDNGLDGCEVDTTSSTANCGACGAVCALPGAATSCVAGTCTLLSCNPGFFDCDGNPGNGCEPAPCAVGSQCGVGADCQSGVCQKGICQAPCAPLTCAEQGVQCGAAGDGCGGVLQCGTCAAPQTCGGGGQPGVCGGAPACGLANCAPPNACVNNVCTAPGSCTPLTCAQIGVQCGPIGDGCGNLLNCGSCAGGQTCGGGGKDFVCGSGGGGSVVCDPAFCPAPNVCNGLACNPPGGCTPANCAAPLQCNAGGFCGPPGLPHCTPALCPAPDVCAGPYWCGIPSSSCTPETCQQQGIQCGPTGDGCGNMIQCGDCPAGETCGAGGQPYVCGAGGLGGCSPATCPAPNACANNVCTSPSSCTPLTCAKLGVQCGNPGDGCGGLLKCAACPAGEACGGGGQPFVCGSGGVCTPPTCAQLGVQCGPTDDGCGDLLQCGGCLAGQSCGGGGQPFVCGSGGVGGCNPATCPAPNACVNNVCTPPGCNPATCLAPNACVNNVCTPPSSCTPQTCAQQGIQCGPTGDGCGNLLDCGGCAGPQTCGGGGVPFVCGSGGGGQPVCDPAFCPPPNVCNGIACSPPAGCNPATCPAPFQCVPGPGAPTCVAPGQPACGPTTCPAPDACVGPFWCYSLSGGGSCTPQTCAQRGIQCGPAGDGCGNLLQCGDCPAGETCGGSGKDFVCGNGSGSGCNPMTCPAPNACVGNVCTPPVGCTPLTCAQQGIQCGPAGDGCGNLLDCGGCAAPQTCGGGGPFVCGSGGGGQPACDPAFCLPPNVCNGSSCSPLGGCSSMTCVAPFQCAPGPFGSVCVSPGQQACSPATCPAPDVCVGPFSCYSLSGGGSCTPETCAQQGIQCGPAGDGCGNLLQCGDCPAGETCGGSGKDFVCGNGSGSGCNPATCLAPNVCVGNVCTPPVGCTPLTCALQGIQCGPAGDGCGGTLDCGGCAAPATCGGGGAPFVCGSAGVGGCNPAFCLPPNSCNGGVCDMPGGCTPATCPAGFACMLLPLPVGGGACVGPGAQCSSVICPAPYVCTGPTTCGTPGGPGCNPESCAQQGIQCGPASDGCGDILQCGGCPAGEVCGGSGKPFACGGAATCDPASCPAPNVCVGNVCAPPGCNPVTCPAPNVCAGNGCTPPGGCSPPLASCAALCVDLATDPNNCGGCGIACGPGLQCLAGVCGGACPAPLTSCGATCTDTSEDPSNCGGCGIACAPGDACVAAACSGASCPPPTVLCGGVCSDPQSDANNCGGCGIACSQGQACVNGACACQFPSCNGLMIGGAVCNGCGAAQCGCTTVPPITCSCCCQ